MIRRKTPAVPSDLNLARLRKFLNKNKFENVGDWGPHLERFQFYRNKQRYDVLLPKSRDIDDFEKRALEAIRETASALNSEPTDIIRNVRILGFDQFDIGARPGTQISSIGYAEGTEILRHGAELVRHSAIRAYTNEYRPQNRGRRPAKVDQYMEQLEIGQTSIGSYVFSLLLPNDYDGIGWGGKSGSKDDRSVKTVLASGVKLAAQVDKSRRAPSKTLIEETGLAAEFFEHLYEIIDWSDDVSLSLHDSESITTRPLFTKRFNRRSLIPIERTVEKIVPAADTSPQEIVGTITSLNEPRIRRRGSITLKVNHKGRTRSVRVPFGFQDRELIIEAFRFKSSKNLSVSGRLSTERNGHLIMKDIENFRIVNQGSLNGI